MLNEEAFNTLDDAHRKIALWRYNYNAVRLNSCLATSPRPKRAGRLGYLWETRPKRLP